MKVSKGCKLIVLGVLLVVIDQIVKVLVKTNMTLGEVIPVFGDWFRLCFVENEGMAFGMKFGGAVGKYILTTFRILLSVAIIWWLSKLVRKPDTPAGVLIGLTAIAAGAALVALGGIASQKAQAMTDSFTGSSSSGSSSSTASNDQNISTELTIHVVGRLDGKDILLSSERAKQYYSR